MGYFFNQNINLILNGSLKIVPLVKQKMPTKNVSNVFRGIFSIRT